MMKRKDEMLKSAAQRYGSPLYVFDVDVFHARYRYLKQQLGSEIRINYCMKTNPFLTQVSLEETDRIEVCSYGEFLICRELHIEPERLLISGVLKKREDMEVIMEYGKDAAIYTAESPAQVRLMNDIALKNGYRAPLYMRLNCGQFGMDADTIVGILQSPEQIAGIEFLGIHYFTGTQKHKLRKHEKEIQKLDGLFARIQEETDYVVRHLEYGTGFGVPYFKDQSETVTTPEQLQEFKKILENMQWKGQINLEMGRALAYNCGSYITQVRDVKCNEGKHYAITDGGIHQLHYDGQLRGMYEPGMRVLRNEFPGVSKMVSNRYHYAIHGSLCTTNDVLVSDYETEELVEGDYIVFENVGAYSVYEGMSLFLSHELPGVVLYSEDRGLQQVRRSSETYLMNTPRDIEIRLFGSRATK